MADFEKAIINASLQTFPDVNVSCGFFHLGRSMYRKIHSEGLQEAYNELLPARGRRRRVLPRYAIDVWNQHDATKEGAHRATNVSEGWHNRFRMVAAKHHPDLYSALTEFQKEQADTESLVEEFELGRAVKAAPKSKWVATQKRLQTITLAYPTYKEEDRVFPFLRALGHNIVIS